MRLISPAKSIRGSKGWSGYDFAIFTIGLGDTFRVFINTPSGHTLYNFRLILDWYDIMEKVLDI